MFCFTGQENQYTLCLTLGTQFQYTSFHEQYYTKITYVVGNKVALLNPFYYQLMHITLKNAELLKHSKLDKNAPTCFGLHRNRLQGAKVSAWLKITHLVYSIPSHSARYTRLTGHNMQP